MQVSTVLLVLLVHGVGRCDARHERSTRLARGPPPIPLAVRGVVEIDGGTTLTSAGRYTQVKLGEDGLPLVIYNRDWGNVVRAQHCLDQLCHQRSQGVNLSTEGKGGRFINLVMSQGGIPLVSWAGDEAIEFGGCVNSTCSTPHSVFSLSPSPGAYPSIAVDEAGLPQVSYYGEAGGLHLSRCVTVRRCDDAVHIELVGGLGIGKYPSLAICQGGVPCVAFQDSGHLSFVSCVDADCSRIAEKIIIDATGNDDLGTYISMKIGRDGNPVMMYCDETKGLIKVAHCLSEKCDQGGVEITVISRVGVGAYGEFPELDISSLTGFPILSYFNQFNSTRGGLSISQCGDASCSLRTTQTILTGKCGFGRDSSIAMTRDTVYVSFLDYNGNGEEKRAMLAVLTPATEEEEEEAMAPREVLNGKDDICSHAFEE